MDSRLIENRTPSLMDIYIVMKRRHKAYIRVDRDIYFFVCEKSDHITIARSCRLMHLKIYTYNNTGGFILSSVVRHRIAFSKGISFIHSNFDESQPRE